MILSKIIEFFKTLLWGKKISPCQGGCWYCWRRCGRMVTSIEFDCDPHLSCLKKALKATNDQEAQIIGSEFNLR